MDARVQHSSDLAIAQAEERLQAQEAPQRDISFREGGHSHLLLRGARAHGCWRPTVVGILVDVNTELVCVIERLHRERASAKPDVPKGGVEPYEPVAFSALRRELNEEVSLPPHQLLHPAFLGSADIRQPKSRCRDGYRKGKRYLIFGCAVDGRGLLAPGKRDNVLDVAWMSPTQFPEHFHKGSRKRALFAGAEFQEALADYVRSLPHRMG